MLKCTKHAISASAQSTKAGVGSGGGSGFTAVMHMLEKVCLPGSVIVAATRPAAGTPTAKTLSKGVGDEHA
jgi:hypothetical protein